MKKNPLEPQSGAEHCQQKFLPAVRYFDADEHWPEIAAVKDNPDLRQILDNDVAKALPIVPDTNLPGMMPWHWHAPSNRKEIRKRLKGLEPRPYWNIVLYFCAPYTVNYYLGLAMRVAPQYGWRIRQSSRYVTVWNGVDLVFDPHAQMYGWPPRLPLYAASERGRRGAYTELEPGQYLKVHPLSHLSK